MWIYVMKEWFFCHQGTTPRARVVAPGISKIRHRSFKTKSKSMKWLTLRTCKHQTPFKCGGNIRFFAALFDYACVKIQKLHQCFCFLLTLHDPNMHSLETTHLASVHSPSLAWTCTNTPYCLRCRPFTRATLGSTALLHPPHIHSSFALCEQARCQRARLLFDDILLQPELDRQHHHHLWIASPLKVINKPPTCVPCHDNIE